MVKFLILFAAMLSCSAASAADYVLMRPCLFCPPVWVRVVPATPVPATPVIVVPDTAVVVAPLPRVRTRTRIIVR